MTSNYTSSNAYPPLWRCLIDTTSTAPEKLFSNPRRDHVHRARSLLLAIIRWACLGFEGEEEDVPSTHAVAHFPFLHRHLHSKGWVEMVWKTGRDVRDVRDARGVRDMTVDAQ